MTDLARAVMQLASSLPASSTAATEAAGAAREEGRTEEEGRTGQAEGGGEEGHQTQPSTMSDISARRRAMVVGAEIAAAERALQRLFRLTLSRRMHNRKTAAVSADVTRGRYAVLWCLGDVARECSMDPAAASRQVRPLEVDGLVEKAVEGLRAAPFRPATGQEARQR